MFIQFFRKHDTVVEHKSCIERFYKYRTFLHAYAISYIDFDTSSVLRVVSDILSTLVNIVDSYRGSLLLFSRPSNYRLALFAI